MSSVRREGRDLVHEINSDPTKKVLIQALEKELASIQEEKAKLMRREAAITKTLNAYNPGRVVVRATRELNTVDMARTVIRNEAVQ